MTRLYHIYVDSVYVQTIAAPSREAAWAYARRYVPGGGVASEREESFYHSTLPTAAQSSIRGGSFVDRRNLVEALDRREWASR